MGVIPEVSIKPFATKMITQPGMAGVVALVGAFDSDEKKLESFNNLAQAQEVFGSDDSVMGCASLKQIFRRDGGASSVICANITTKTGETKETEMTVEKLKSALSSIKGEKFDILFIAAELTEEGMNIVKDFLDESYDLQKPVGTILPLNRDTVAKEQTTAEIFKTGGLYGLIDQQFTVKNKQLSIVESAAYYCGVVAGLKVDQSMTMSELPEVTSITPEYGFSENEDGANLVSAGVSVARCMDRVNQKYVIVNSEQPSGLDLYIERTKDFLIRQIALEEYLGDKNTSNSLTAIRSAIETKKQLFLNTLKLLEDITYNVEKVSSNCVNVYLDTLKFAGVITKIDVYVTMEVE